MAPFSFKIKYVLCATQGCKLEALYPKSYQGKSSHQTERKHIEHVQGIFLTYWPHFIKNQRFFSSQISVFLDEICHEKEICDKYGLSDCCGQTGEGRHQCLLARKKTAVASVMPFSFPEPAESCKAYKENREMFMNR